MKRMMLVLLGLTVSSCGMFTMPDAQPFEVPIRYSVVPDAKIAPYGGLAYFDHVDGCSVQIADQMFKGYAWDLVRVVAHEAGHCFDFSLNLNHGGYSDQEEFAQAYAFAYLAKCGRILQPLGWPGAQDGTCDLPDPRTVRK